MCSVFLVFTETLGARSCRSGRKMVDDPPNLFIIYVFRLIKPPKKIFGAGGFLGTPQPMGPKTPKDRFRGSWAL